MGQLSNHAGRQEVAGDAARESAFVELRGLIRNATTELDAVMGPVSNRSAGDAACEGGIVGDDGEDGYPDAVNWMWRMGEGYGRVTGKLPGHFL